MQEKILSIFIDESGDFGKFDSKNPYYYVSLVLHDQSIDITENIKNLEEQGKKVFLSKIFWTNKRDCQKNDSPFKFKN